MPYTIIIICLEITVHSYVRSYVAGYFIIASYIVTYIHLEVPTKFKTLSNTLF